MGPTPPGSALGRGLPASQGDIRIRGQRRGERDIVKATTAVPGEYAVSRPLEVVQIDHTEIDIIVVDELARPALADPRHRRLLARGDGASCVGECAITRVGRPVQNGIRKSSLTLTANLRLGPASVSSQNAQRREKSRSLMPRCQVTATTSGFEFSVHTGLTR